MASPNRTRVSPQDGCLPSAQLITQLREPNGAQHEWGEDPFLSRDNPVYNAETTQEYAYGLALSGPFAAGNWELTLTWRHRPNGPTTCIGEITLNSASLEVVVRR
jgi:hypothetical protein